MNLNFLPMVAVAISILTLMLAIALKRDYRLSFGIALSGLLVAFLGSLSSLFGEGYAQSSKLFVFDGFAWFYQSLVLFCAIFCVLLAYRYFKNFNDNKEELFLLMLTATLGGLVLSAATHFAAFFVGLELLSVPMYGMLGYTFLKKRSLEAAMKYLILSAAASATLLMGMAFVFAGMGTLSFGFIGEAMMAQQAPNALFILGVVMMIAAMSFKLSLAPFHAWAGDVYQGANPAVGAFLASASKVAVLAVAVRFLIQSATPLLVSVDAVLFALVLLSVVVGNLLALYQSSFKRLMAFSSVAHMGYVLMIVIAQGSAADIMVASYVLVYALTALGVFGVVAIMSGGVNAKDADNIAYYQGLFWRRPVLSAVMTVMLLSLAGIPLTAGFMTKMQVMMAVVEGGRFWLAALLVLGSAIGLYYYLKTILIMYKRPAKRVVYDAPNQWRTGLTGLVLLAMAAVLVFFGVLPSGLFDLAAHALIG